MQQRTAMRAVLLYLVSVTVLGCSDDRCAGETCPGPCSASGTFSRAPFAVRDCQFGYDLNGKLTSVFCAQDVTEAERDPDSVSGDNAIYGYAAGELSAIDTLDYYRGRTGSSAHWTFDGETVTVGSTVYDRRAFALLPMQGSERAEPRAELGLRSYRTLTVSDRDIAVAWQVVGPELESRATTADGNLVAISRYGFDAEAHLVSIARCTGCTDGSQVQRTDVFAYDAGQLVLHEQLATPPQVEQVTRYAYDRHGNLRAIDFSGDITGHEAYGYACW